MEFFKAMSAICSNFNSKTYDLDNSCTKGSMGALKRTGSKVKADYDLLNTLALQKFEFDTLIEAFIIFFKHLSDEFDKDKDNYFKDKSTESVFIFLDYLLSPKFQLTKLSKQFKTGDLETLKGLKINFNSIFNQNTNNTTAPITQVSASSSHQSTMPPGTNSLIPDINQMSNAQMFEMMKNLFLMQNNNQQPSQNRVIFGAQSENNVPDLSNNQIVLKLKNLLQSKITKENHLENNLIHLEKHTTPPSLFFNRMPVPFLKDNHSFIEAYNEQCFKFQEDTLNLTNNHLYLEIDRINIEITTLSNKYNNIITNEIIKETTDKTKLAMFNQLKENTAKTASKISIPFKVVSGFSPKKDTEPYRQNNYRYSKKSEINSSHKRSRDDSNSDSDTNNNNYNNNRGRSSSRNNQSNNINYNRSRSKNNNNSNNNRNNNKRNNNNNNRNRSNSRFRHKNQA